MAATLVMLLLIVMGAHIKNSHAAFRVVPNKRQFSEYDFASFHCEGLDGSILRGIRNHEGFLTICTKKMSPLSCNISRAYLTDSGEYWCETDKGERSESVNITVTSKSVILESPVLPVMEGYNVTLRCRTREDYFNLLTHFYKDGLMWSSSTGELTLHSVSKSDEGFYKCNIFGVDSPQSWLTVLAHQHRETCPSSAHFLNVLAVLRTFFTIVLVMLLLLLLGLIHFEKIRLVPNHQNHTYTWKIDWPLVENMPSCFGSGECGSTK